MVSCKPNEVTLQETKDLQAKVSSREDAQKQMIKELYQFYNSSDKSLEFYEIKWDTYYLINYNPKKQMLHISVDICSGWLSHYINVTEDKLKKVSESDILFEQYGNILEKEKDQSLRGVVKTNGCMGY
jgi:hypothetical protein